MNRKQRRQLKRTLMSSGMPEQKAKSVIIASDVLNGRNYNRVFENGDPVKLDLKSILSGPNTDSYSDAYVKFITENKDEIFHVARLDKYPDGAIVGLRENDIYYFHPSNLIPAKE